MKVAAFFAGVGGIEFGLGRAGHTTAFLCDKDPYARAVLENRFSAPVHGEVESLSPELVPIGVELATAGFPCQDLSQAGGTRGIGGKKSSVVKHLFEILATRRIPWLLIENVPFMLQLEKGGAMSYLVENLEALGYGWAYRVIDTRAFGLPQRRQRVFLLASREADPSTLLFESSRKPPKDTRAYTGKACGFYWTEGTRGLGWAVDAIPTLKGGSSVGIPSPPGVWIPGGRKGMPAGARLFTPGIEDGERLQGFEKGWTSAAEAVDSRGHRYRWKLVGNAVSVDVAEWIGERLASGKQSRRPRSAVRLIQGSPWPKAAFGSRGKRFSLPEVSTWPIDDRNARRSAQPLRVFLRSPRPLSARAAVGFQKRFRGSRLQKPEGFLDDLALHVKTMKAVAISADSPQASTEGAVVR